MESYSTVFTYPLTDPYDLRNMYGFNHAPSITTTPNGNILCAWFSGPYEASVHQVLLASYSHDFGKSWQRAHLLQDEPKKSDFDVAFIRDSQRVWMFYIYGRWSPYPVGTQKFKAGKDTFHLYARYTKDSGKTWSNEILIDRTAGCRSNGIKLASGEMLLPIHDFESSWNRCGVLRSEDSGKTWTKSAWIKNKHKAGTDEPTIAELSNGHVMMVLRTNDGNLWTVISKDKGKTWLQPQKNSSITAGDASHNIFRLKNGKILLTHNACRPGFVRSPLVMRISGDGITWSSPLILAESDKPGKENDYWGCQVTYPSVCQINDDTVIAVWTKINMSDVEQYGEIHSARIKILK